MIYLCGWMALYWGLFASHWRGRPPQMVAVLAILFIAFIAVLRGNVGTDTESYEYWAGAVRDGAGLVGAEPGFTGLLYILTSGIESNQMVIRAIALIYALLVLQAYRQGDRDERFVLLSFFLPAFFFIHSMNVVRLGMAAALLLTAAMHARDQRQGKFKFFAALAVIFHYTSALPVLILWATTPGRSDKRGVVPAVLILLSIFAYLWFNLDWIDQKSVAYSELQTPDELSGLSQIAIVLALLAAIASSGLPVMARLKLTGLGAALAIGGWVLARQSYAGLRLLDLLSLSLPLAFLINLGTLGIALNRRAKVCLLLAGLLSVAAQYRGFLANESVGASPFLPYTSLLSE